MSEMNSQTKTEAITQSGDRAQQELERIFFFIKQSPIRDFIDAVYDIWQHLLFPSKILNLYIKSTLLAQLFTSQKLILL